MPERKALTGLKVTDEAAGTVEAIFATLNVVDKDGDVTLPGAFTDGQKVKISAYNHTSWNGALPVGRGEIREDGDLAIMKGQFFLDTTAGAETFTVVKRLAELGEWSYGYDILENSFGTFGDDDRKVQFLRKLLVHEVAPVILGAGIDTRTLAMKGAGRGMKLAEHAEAVLTAFDELVGRVDEVAKLRRAERKTLGESTQVVLERYEVTMKRLRDVLTTEPPPKQDDQAALLRELARVQTRRATILTT